ncbi:hypothetical protein LTR50_006418 [Elasticomyces elasticus]|nr:hypothetical protein LTR50_006418 [Elasticomyces elasticus]
MKFLWHFIDLDKQQKQERRRLLDRHALIAQSSILVPLLILQLYFVSRRTWKRVLRKNSDSEEPSSPFLKVERSKRIPRTRKVGVLWTRAKWWAGEPVEVFETRLGRRGELVGAVVWTAWLMFLCVVQTGDDYLHLTKRFGIVGASQLPLQYLLALKAPYSPFQLATHLSHETLNIAHQLLGRTITLLFYLHTIFYLNFFIVKSLLAKRIKDRDVILGLVAIVLFTAIGTTALGRVRRWNYRLFYVLHITSAAALLPVLYWHVHHIRIYVWETAAVYILNATLRHLNTRRYEGTISQVQTTSLLKIEIALPPDSSRVKIASWKPGQHVYLSPPQDYGALRNIFANPFTIASLPEKTGRLAFVARILDGNTLRLATLAQTPLTGSSITLSVEGPYGVPPSVAELLLYDKILIVAGGVGATFAMPVFRSLQMATRKCWRPVKTRFLWTVRDVRETSWAHSQFDDISNATSCHVEIFVTRAGKGGTGVVSSLNDQRKRKVSDSVADHEQLALSTNSADDIELQEREGLLNVATTPPPKTKDSSVCYGRLPLGKIVDETFAGGNIERVAVLICGPAGLSRDLRKEVGRWVPKGREVWWHAEEFGW